MARRLFLHVGTPKSGTTFLQSVWWANRDALLEQGLLLPGRGVNHHYWASCVVRGGRQVDTIPAAGLAAWDELLAEVSAHPGDALISHELFSPAPDERAEAALRRLEAVADEVHVVLTARDLVRQIPAEWQQRTKHGRSQTYDAFLDMIQKDEQARFWRVQDVPGVLRRWGQGIPPERVHLVVLPPPGGPRTFLWDRLCELTGIDGTGMAERATRSNESLGLVEVETLRRLAGTLQDDGMPKSTQRLLKDFVAEQVLRTAEPEKIVVPARAYPWVVERAQQMVAELDGQGYDVLGDLAGLVPGSEPIPGRDAADVTDAEVADAAVAALARFVRHEELQRRRGRRRPPESSLRSRVRHGLARRWTALRARAGRS
ncbi:hypothetical protein [Nocardioides euryhalodurans]|uniref:Sulfotransferase family protein n=1 Tax=Nocardioides euryhalodurans TaxID=2518370 RepID=A0A4P7GJL3_9ACTN|nr:hypothetical protein [Nocardioides euryhalodurans]QBR91937.1 hypothetical protein EXE57_06340 [Nocardioides euryhalodurans]